MHVHPVGVQVRGDDEGARHRGDQVLPLAPDGVDLVGGIGLHSHQLSQARTAVGVEYIQPQQLVVKVHALGQVGVGAADGEHLVPQGQCGVHIVHAGEFHEHDVLVHVVGSGPDELAVQQKCGKAGEHVGVCVPGLYPHLAPDAVGAHDLSDFDGIQLHGGSLLLLIAVVYPLLPGQARGACAWGGDVVC